MIDRAAFASVSKLDPASPNRGPADDAKSLSKSSGLVNPMALASRLKISWLGNNYPRGGVVFLCAEIDELKYEHDHVIEFEKASRRKHIIGVVGGIGLEEIEESACRMSSRSSARLRRRCLGLGAAMLLFQVM